MREVKAARKFERSFLTYNNKTTLATLVLPLSSQKLKKNDKETVSAYLMLHTWLYFVPLMPAVCPILRTAQIHRNSSTPSKNPSKIPHFQQHHRQETAATHRTYSLNHEGGSHLGPGEPSGTAYPVTQKKKKKIWPVLFGFVAIWKSFLGVYLKFAWLKTAKNSESRKFSRKIVTTRRYFRTFWMLWCHARSEGDRGWRLIFLHLFDPFHIVHQNLF